MERQELYRRFRLPDAGGTRHSIFQESFRSTMIPSTRFLFAACLLGIVPLGASAGCPPLLNEQMKTLEGKPLDLCQFEGKAILVVNTASKCGFTPQFDKLEGMYKQYKDQGLVVLGFPSNDFRQELASNQEVGDFCRMTYGVKFPMAEKSSVTGDGANPFFKRLADSTMDPPRWNFHKYLIAPDGKTVYSFESSVAPDSAQVMARLQPMLKK
jgi:glutathione peroxidase